MALAYQPPVFDDRGPVEIRPSWKALGYWELRVGSAVILVMALVTGRFIAQGISSANLAIVFLLWGTGIGGYALYITAYMLGTRITVTTDSILVIHWFTSRATVPTADIARVIRCSLTESDGRAVTTWGRPAVIALAPSGKCVLSLWAERWDRSDLDRIWQHLGVPVESWPDAIRAIDLRKRFPGAF